MAVQMARARGIQSHSNALRLTLLGLLPETWCYLWEVLDHSFWVSPLVTRSSIILKWTWAVGTTILTHIHKVCTYTNPLSMIRSKGMRWKIFFQFLFAHLFKKLSVNSYYLQTLQPKTFLPGFIGPGLREQSGPWNVHVDYTWRQQDVQGESASYSLTLTIPIRSRAFKPNPLLTPRIRMTEKAC